MVVLFLRNIMTTFIDPSNVQHVQIIRSAKVILGALSLLGLMNLTISYYRYLLSKGRNVVIGNIMLLYMLAVVLFAYLYLDIYHLTPYRFSYQHAPYVTGESLLILGSLGWKATMDFLVYSASYMTAGHYWKIESRSLLVSVVNITQTLYGLFFVVLMFNSIRHQLKAK